MTRLASASSSAPSISRPALTAEMAAWIAVLTYDQIPDKVIRHLKLCLLDSVGCGIYGSDQPVGKIASRFAMLPGAGAARVWGKHQKPKTDVSSAAFANGTSVHAFEIDDVHLEGQIHPGSVVVPAIVALTEHLASGGHAVTGRQFLSAMAAGYETGIRMGIAAGRGHGLSGFHPTGTIGPIAAAAAAANLLQLDQKRTIHAIALGATQAAGLYSARTGGMAKRLHAGRAAASGVAAGLLAKDGFTGSDEAIEAEFGGFLSSFGCDGPMDEILSNLGTEWHCGNVGFKIFSTCASAQTIVEGVQKLRALGLTANNLLRLDVHTSSIAASNVGWRYEPKDVVAAQMNGSYGAAVTLLEGNAFIAQYDEAHLSDPNVLALTSKVYFHAEHAIDARGPNLRHSSRLEACLTDGSVLETYTEQRIGGPGRPIPQEKIVEKFDFLASQVIAKNQVDSLRTHILHAEELADLGLLTGSLVEQKEGTR